ncbi:MAG: hypothetical protein KDA87_06220 [Planctomycetales bacterium]|nr:hypothetical protein [Planctomycetales bacterium]
MTEPQELDDETRKALLEKTQSLAGLAHEMEGYFQQKLSDLEKWAESSQLSESESTDHSEVDQSEWQQARDQEMERLRQDSLRLQEAWAELEDEHRKLLAQKAIQETTGSVGGTQPAAIGNASLSSVLGVSSNNQSKTNQAARTGKSEQFQQMQRDIAKHKQRK